MFWYGCLPKKRAMGIDILFRTLPTYNETLSENFQRNGKRVTVSTGTTFLTASL